MLLKSISASPLLATIPTTRDKSHCGLIKEVLMLPEREKGYSLKELQELADVSSGGY